MLPFEEDMLLDMDQAIQALHMACALASHMVSDIPGVNKLVKGALKLIEMVQETRHVQDECSHLAKRAAMFSAAVYCQLSSGRSTLDTGTATEYIERLIETVTAIQILMKRRKDRFFYALVYRASISKEVKRLNSRLEDSVRVFNIQSSIHINQQIKVLLQGTEHLLRHAENSERVGTALLSDNRRIDSSVQEILRHVRVEATHDGAMRLYARDEVELVEEIGPEETPLEPGEEPVIQFRARLCESGRSVTVRRFPHPGKKFRDAITLAKKIWHPNVVHAIGYSREDPDTTFIVNNGVYTHSYDDFGDTFLGPAGFLWTLESTKKIYSGLMHLMSVCEGVKWSDENNGDSILSERDLVISADGRVMLDVSAFDLKELPDGIAHRGGVITMDEESREMLKTFSNPLEGAPDGERFEALNKLWNLFGEFTSHEREARRVWRTLPFIPTPGQLFNLSTGMPSEGYHNEKQKLCEIMEPIEPWVERIHIMYMEPEEPIEPAMEVHESEQMFYPDLERDDLLDPPTVEYNHIQWTETVVRGTDGEPRSVYHKWKRYEVRDMKPGFQVVTTNGLECPNWAGGEWLQQNALALCQWEDCKLDLNDLAIADGLEFQTHTYWECPPAGSGDEETAFDVAIPSTLYYFERIHSNAISCCHESEIWPWGFWSTEPCPGAVPYLDRRGRKLRSCKRMLRNWGFQRGCLRMSRDRGFQYLGFNKQSGEYVWRQKLAPGLWFWIRIGVVVLYSTFTRDECLVMNEMRREARVGVSDDMDEDEDEASARFETVDDDDDRMDWE